MKREALLRFLRLHGCYLKREGGAHSIWINPATGQIQAVPRHTEVADLLAQYLSWTFPSGHRKRTGLKLESEVMSARERALIENPAGMALHDSFTWDKISHLETELGVLEMLTDEDVKELGKRLLQSGEKFPQAIARNIRMGMKLERDQLNSLNEACGNP